MAINWDAVDKWVVKERARLDNEYAKAKNAPKPTTKTVPKVTPKTSNPRVRNSATLQSKVSTESMQRDVNSPLGGFAIGQSNAISPFDETNSFRKDIDVTGLKDRTSYKAGTLFGTAAQFAIPYGATGGVISNAVKAIPKVAKMGKIGQAVAGSVATDLAVGLPLNVNYAYQKEGLTGTDALKSIASNTAIDLVTGGILEAIGGVILKSGKKVASKADFDTLQPDEQKEVLLMLPEPKSFNEPNPIAPGNVVAGDKVYGTRFEARNRDEYISDLENQFAGFNVPTWNKLDTNYGRYYQDETIKLAQKLDNVKNMTDEEWIKYAQENNIGKTVTDFNNPAGDAPLEFKTQIGASQLGAFNEAKATQGKTIPNLNRTNAGNGNVPPKQINSQNMTNPSRSGANNGTLDLGADTLKDSTMKSNLDQYGAIPPKEQPRARDVELPRETPYGQTQEGVQTIAESNIVDDVLLQQIKDEVNMGTFGKYTRKNTTAVADALDSIEKNGIDSELNSFRNVLAEGKQPTSIDIAKGALLLERLQLANRYADAMDVAVDLSQMLSESGRTLQAARIIKRLSPEGRLLSISRMRNKLTKEFGVEIKLSDETISKVQNAATDAEKAKAMHDAGVEMWDQVPANWMDKVNAWRYMAMLMNPKTHVRNIVGNSLFIPAREFKNLIATGLEKAFVNQADRTKAVLNPFSKVDKSRVEFARKDFKDVLPILKNEGKLDEKVRPGQAKVFSTRVLEGARKLNLNLMDAEDTWFLKFAYDGSLAQYMKARKLSPEQMTGKVLDDAREYAMDEALKATYRDANKFSKWVNRQKQMLEGGSLGQRVGGVALEGALPFTKTPANILKRGIEYSPIQFIGAVKSLGKDLKAGKTTAETMDKFASAITGSVGLMGAGYMLGMNGIVSGKENQHGNKASDYNTMQGSQNYSINVGDGSYTIDWAAPLSMPFFVGVEIANWAKNGKADPDKVFDSLLSIPDPMFNLTMLKGITDIFKNNYGEDTVRQVGTDMATGYLSQFNPTVFGQIARTIDPYRRSTISTNESPTMKSLETFRNKQQAKVPGSSRNLPKYVDNWGRTQENGSALENFLSPGYYKKSTITPADKEINRLVETLGEDAAKGAIPMDTSSYDVKGADGTSLRMNPYEFSNFKEVRGTKALQGVQALIKSKEYKQLPDAEKVKAINKVHDEAFVAAKMQYFKNKGLPQTLALDKSDHEKYLSVKSLGIKDIQFINIINKADSNGNGGITQEEAKTVLDRSNLTTEQKRAMFQTFNKGWKKNPY